MDGAYRNSFRVLVGKLTGRYYLEDPGVDGRIILKCIFSKWGGGMDWNDLHRYRDRWRAVVNALMKLGIQ